MGAFVSQAFSGNGIDILQIAEAGAVAALTAGAFSAANVGGAEALQQVGSKIASGSITATEVGSAIGLIAERSVITAGIDTAIYGGSFANALQYSALSDAAAVGAGAIGYASQNDKSWMAQGSPGYVLAHAGLGCAISAAEGTGCAGGAIGGAVSAAFSPDLVKAVDPTGAPLDPGQQAALAAFATLAGGGLAGLAGQNAMAGATAAQNEALNNTGDHAADAAKKGGLLNALGTWLQNTYGDPVGSFQNWGNQFLGLVTSNNGQTPPSDPNPLVQANNGNPPNTGASPVTPAVPVCDPPVCTMIPGAPGTPSHITLSSGNGSGDTVGGQGSSTDNGRVEIDDSRAGHIFRDSDGHISDTPANRQLLESVANDPSAVLGTDKYGTTWAAKINPDGTQTWVGIRGGKVSYGGINQTPKSFNPQTGLASPTRPG